MKHILIILFLINALFSSCGDGMDILFSEEKEEKTQDEIIPSDDQQTQNRDEGVLKIAIDPSCGIWFASELYLDTYAADPDINGEFAQVVNLLIAIATDPNNLVLIKEKIAEYRTINPALFNPLIVDSVSIDITDGMPDAIHAFWSNENLYMKIQNDYKAGYYNLTLKAINNNVLGSLPAGYTSFQLDVVDGASATLGTITIPAGCTEYNSGSIQIYLGTGDSTLNLLWKNDVDDGNYDDSNIQIKDIGLVFVSE